MKIFKNTFGSLKPSFLIKAYIIGIFLFILLDWFLLVDFPNNLEAAPIMMMLINLILFPFSYLIYHDIKVNFFSNDKQEIIVGDGTFWIFFGIIKVALFILIYSILFGAAFLIAPIGILYIYIQNKKQTD